MSSSRRRDDPLRTIPGRGGSQSGRIRVDEGRMRLVWPKNPERRRERKRERERKKERKGKGKRKGKRKGKGKGKRKGKRKRTRK